MDDACYGHYNELVEAGTAYLQGKISRGIFEETVNRVLIFVREGRKQFDAILLPPELSARFKPIMQKARKGFILFEQGIEKMRQAVDADGKREGDFWQGIGLARFGCDLLNEVLENQEKFLEDGESG